jgi:hemerythrin-like metal-binding protein
MYVDWLPEYSVEVAEIDEQHKKFVLLINDLYDAVEIGCVDITLGDTIEQLLAYADYHFATEEKYFDKFDYAKAGEHRLIHMQFRETVQGFHDHYPGKELECSKKIMEFMKNWLTNHIITKDHEYSACFHEHGLK